MKTRACDPTSWLTSVRRASQAGSAYIVALMVLLVLTMIGMSLTFVTQTEMLMGSNQRLLEQAFFASESGISIGMARALVANDRRPITETFEHPRSMMTDPNGVEKPLGVPMLQRIETTPFYPILDSPCNLCEVNNEGTYANKSFQKVNHALTVRSTLMGVSGHEISSKTLALMISIEPADLPPDAFESIDDPEALKKIKF